MVATTYPRLGSLEVDTGSEVGTEWTVLCPLCCLKESKSLERKQTNSVLESSKKHSVWQISMSVSSQSVGLVAELEEEILTPFSVIKQQILL